MKKTYIHAGIAAYLLTLNHKGEKALTKEEQQKTRDTLWASLNMLFSIKEPIDPVVLDNALANLLAYIVSNGKESYAEKTRHLSCIVLKTRLILEMVSQPPLAEVLDYIHGKKKHPLINTLIAYGTKGC